MGGIPLVLPVQGLVMTQQDKGINAKHSEWSERALAYYHIDLLTRGGYEIRREAANFLWKKPKEQNDVFGHRSSQMTYQNLIGTGLAWYVAAMFREKWRAQFRLDGELIQDPDPDDFYLGFMSNVDRRGTSFSDFLAQVFETMLKFQKAWVLTDLPAANPQAFANLAQQKAAGALNPYLVLYDPRNVIQWDYDDDGNLNFVVIWAPTIRRTFKAGAKVVDRWFFYDRSQYQIYEAERPEGQTEPAADKARVTAGGPHALASFNRVPVRCFAVKEIFWLANRAYPQALDHLNQDNTYRFALMMANLPMPAVIGEYDDPPNASETELTVLPQGSEFKWLEPAGTSFEHSAKRLSQLREEIYRQMYLITQGKDSTATASAASGYSKEMDARPSTDVCARFAALLRDCGANILRDVADARGDVTLTASVSGTDFIDGDVDADLATLDLLGNVNIPSDTLEKSVQVQVALRLAKDEPDETKERIKDEILNAPTKSERQAQVQQQMQGGFSRRLQQGIERFVGSSAVDEIKGVE